MSRCLAAAALAALAACGDEVSARGASFRGPAAMAVAGADKNRLFVANRAMNALQVVEVAAALGQSQLLPAPARFHPLAIQAGVAPGSLAASGDGAVVFVASATDGTVRAIDAAGLTPLRGADGALDAPVLPAGAGAVPSLGELAVSARGCAEVAGCTHRLFVVARGGVGRIAVVDAAVDLDAGRVDFAPRAPLPLAGAVPRSIAVWAPPGAAAAAARQESLLVATDGGDVHVLDLVAGVASDTRQVRVAASPAAAAVVGPDPAGPMALSGDGLHLVVARPRWADVLVYSVDPATGLGDNPVDLDSAWAPLPEALGACGLLAGDPALALAHPADRALCSDGNAVAARPNAGRYPGIYLGAPARQMLALPSTQANISGLWGPTRDLPEGQAAAGGALGEAVAVALADGQVAVIALRDRGGAVIGELLGAPESGTDGGLPPARATLSSHGADTSAALDIREILAPCDAGDAGARLACLADRVVWAAGTLAGRGDGRQRLTLQWEGVLASGSTTAAGARLQDPSADFAAAGVVAGDTVVITSQTRDPPGPQCLALAAASPCPRERRVVGVADGNHALVLAGDLAADCFAATNLAYEVRATQAFTVQLGTGRLAAPLLAPRPRAGEAPGRVAAGGAVGLGTTVLGDSAMLLRLAATPLAEKTGCELYDRDGRRLHDGDQAAWLSRAVAFTIEVYDPARPQRLGLGGDGPDGSLTAAGLLPAGLALVPPVGDGSASGTLAVSYAGSDGVVLVQPGDLRRATAVLAEPQNSRLLD